MTNIKLFSQSSQAYLQHLLQLSVVDKRILNYLMWMSPRYLSLRVSQARIAKKTGYSLRYVHERLQKLEQWGYISSIYKHMETKIYYISQIFNDSKLRTDLMGVFSVFRTLAVSLLFSVQPNLCQSQKELQSVLCTPVSCYSFIYKTLLNCRTMPTQELSTKRVKVSNSRTHPRGQHYNENATAIQKRENITMDFQQRRETIEQLKSGKAVSPVFEEIEKITELDLSVYGQVRLTAFCPAAIVEARKEYKRVAKDRISYGILWNVAKNYCVSRQIPLHNWYVKEVSAILKYQEDTPVLKKSNKEPLKREGSGRGACYKDSFTDGENTQFRLYSYQLKAWLLGVDYRKYSQDAVTRIIRDKEYPPNYSDSLEVVPEPQPWDRIQKYPDEIQLIKVKAQNWFENLKE